MSVCLFVFHGILLTLGTTYDLVSDSATVYLGTAAVVLVTSALPYPFLVGSYVATLITIGESFDVSSRDCSQIPLVFPMLYLLFGMLLSYPCLQMIELHHPGFLFSTVIRSKRFFTTILVIDITGKTHTFCFVPYATIKLKGFEISNKCQIPDNK